MDKPVLVLVYMSSWKCSLRTFLSPVYGYIWALCRIDQPSIFVFGINFSNTLKTRTYIYKYNIYTRALFSSNTKPKALSHNLLSIITMESTPEKSDATEEIAEMLTEMGLEFKGWSREMETRTIEGSPMIHHIRKKVDNKLTPAPFRLHETIEENVSVPIMDLKGEEGGGHVYIFSCGTSTHDTKDHQENMQRTTLISGIDGCLRRNPFKNIVSWEDTAVGEACMADILRYSTLLLYSLSVTK